MIHREATGQPSEDGEEQAAALATLIAGCTNPGVERQVLVVRVADLPTGLIRPQHVRLIVGALDPLRSLDRASLFHLVDDTLVMVWRGAGLAELHAARTNLERLFADLSIFPVKLMALPRDAAELSALLVVSVGPTGPPPRALGNPLDPATLSELEVTLSSASLAHLVHRLPICRWPEGESAQLAWEKRRVSIRHLNTILAPGTDMRADPWLFRRLTRSLDRCMLNLLCDPQELREAGPFAIDLNITSILGSEFVRFDAALPQRLRGNVVLGVSPVDAISDINSFALACDFARARGYRIMLRKISVPMLGVFPAGLLPIDLIQLDASGIHAHQISREMASRMVLSHVTDSQGVAWGHQQGICLFEGPFVHPNAQTLPYLKPRRFKYPVSANSRE